VTVLGAKSLAGGGCGPLGADQVEAEPRRSAQAVTWDLTITLGLGRHEASSDETMRERIWQTTGTVSGFT
jgi:hypothetical protein